MPEETPTIKQYPLERRKIFKKFIGGMIVWTILFLIAIVITAFFSQGLLLAVELVLFALLALFYWWYEVQYFNRYYYDIKQDFLVIKKGVFAPRETTLPYEKLQDVYIDQDLLDRIFNLWDLHVSTATILSGWEAHIDGVNVANGEAMKKIILGKIKDLKK